ncbi:MAG: hypothetical protein H6722_10120 [Sandaracinus sp.]|nr:hypothetical protein [Sandaracinus sp.]MCB9618224.1 hypothetical protein [Sandaracinus sp.]MCB9625402.1 hypothetical protein [Sandaracinus sp.]
MTVRCLARVSLVWLLGCGSPAPEEPPTHTSGGESAAPTHGAEVFAVYVVVADPGAAALEEAAAPLREQALHVSVGELGCDEGAAEALGAAPEAHAVSVTFDTREDADAFAATLSEPPVGIARVTVRCAD